MILNKATRGGCGARAVSSCSMLSEQPLDGRPAEGNAEHLELVEGRDEEARRRTDSCSRRSGY
jgi:hypothetical protein